MILALLLVGVSPLIFPTAQAGYASMHTLAVKLLLPSLAVLILLVIFASWLGWNRLVQSVVVGAWAGAVGTLGLELVRETGFRIFHSMPGDLPMLMGVLLTDRMMLGPNLLSNLAGWAYHFENGAAFGILYVLIFGKRPWWNGLIFGFLVGIGFMVSPVVKGLGVGYFGREFGWGFPITVTLAHLEFGGILGGLSHRFMLSDSGLIFSFPRLVTWYQRCFCRSCGGR
jgi:hypothetical protein